MRAVPVLLCLHLGEKVFVEVKVIGVEHVEDKSIHALKKVVRANATQDAELAETFDGLLSLQDQSSLTGGLSPQRVDVAVVMSPS